jgi:hypothetical protein
MPDPRLIAAPRVLASRGFQIALDVGHGQVRARGGGGIVSRVASGHGAN